MKKVHLSGMAILILSLLVVSCGSGEEENSIFEGMGSGMSGGGMMPFHMATIPEPYASMTSPVESDQESISRGEEIYVAQCASCHGDGGMGDGPVGTALDPSPAAIAHTSQMMSDAYLFWRISEGGADFETAMPTFAGTLDEQAQWDVINYVRALGSGDIIPGNQYGGAMNDPAAQAAQQAEMLSTAVSMDVITQEEANVFDSLHAVVDEFMENNRGNFSQDGGTMMESGLDEMVNQGILSQAEADQFIDIHDRLLEAGLME